jgi:alkylated DNA repair protein (DNA oxidative demethylase)
VTTGGNQLELAISRAPRSPGSDERLGPGSLLLRGFALADEERLLADLEAVATSSAFRHMVTPGGFRMSVAMTNTGRLGWISDASGYRYSAVDPETGRAWPQMPAIFAKLATSAAERAGYAGFVSDACLVNRYEPGARLTLHQDKDERDFSAPIVSVSLGLSAVFLFGGTTRKARPGRFRLEHGDVVVWGGADRLRYHGVLPLADGVHPRFGRARVNLTFRKAG